MRSHFPLDGSADTKQCCEHAPSFRRAPSCHGALKVTLRASAAASAWSRRSARRSPASTVPRRVKHHAPRLAEDYHEACLVVYDSPKASAALSRRCLQALLKLKGGSTKRDLADTIQEVLGSKQLPSDLAGDLDAIRQCRKRRRVRSSTSRRAKPSGTSMCWKAFWISTSCGQPSPLRSATRSTRNWPMPANHR